jgi:hypothetical protein
MRTPSVDQIKTVLAILGTTNWKGALDALEHPATFDNAALDAELALKIVGIFFPPAAQAELIIEVLQLLVDSGILAAIARHGADPQTPEMLKETGPEGGSIIL